MRTVAHIFSNIFIPLLSPTYLCLIVLVFFPSLYTFHQLNEKVLLVLFILLATSLPSMLFVYVLYRLKVIQSTDLVKREDRRWPQLFGCLNYVAVSVALAYYFGTQSVFTLCMFSSTISLCLICIITRYWKISTHAAGVFGMVAVLGILTGHHPADGFNILFAIMIIAAVMVCYSRYYLRVHTIMQLIAGSCLAYAIVYGVFYSFW